MNQRVWLDDERVAGWTPAPCTGWSAGPAKALLAASGQFHMSGDTTQMAARLASISRLTQMIYWSSTRSRWRNLFEEAYALARPEQDARRQDFVAEDLKTDATLYYWLREDNPTVGVVYQMLIRERTPDRLVFEVVNRSAVKAKFLFFKPQVAGPGEYRQIYYIERESGATWSYYSLVRMGDAHNLFGTSAANYRNRAEAYFRYLAELDMAREPPASP